MKSFAAAILFLGLAPALFAEKPPAARTEFVDQALDPTGGKIQRPKDWFFTPDHGRTSYAWIISKENAAKESYTTGMRVQEMVSVHAATSQTPREFAADFIATKKKSGANILKTSDEEKVGYFTRVTIETEEGKFHLLYSVYWGDEHLDAVVITTAGTTKELWATYAPVFEKMRDFQLLDVKRYEQKDAAPGGPEIVQGQLVGHWRYTDTSVGVTSDYTFAADGTFSANIMQGPRISWEWSGKWTLDGHTIRYEFTKSSLDQVPAGTKESETVVEIDKDHYTVMPGDGHKRKFVKVP